MTTAERRRLEWLHVEVEKWPGQGLVDPETAARIQRRYPLPGRTSHVSPAVAAFAVLGSLFLGLGVILILARNWDSFGRPVRLVLALFPLTASIGLSLFSFYRKRASTPWREASAISNGLALMGALALVSQIYQLPGDIDTLLLPACVLYLPVMLLLRPLAGHLLYIVGITVWACVAQAAGGQAALYWILFPAALPVLIPGFRANPQSPDTLARVWTLILSLCICLGVCLEKVLPGLWIILYASYFALLYIFGTFPMTGEEESSHQLTGRPFRVVGFFGLIVLAFLLSYSWPWQDIGWVHYRSAGRFVSALAWLDYALTGLFFLGSLAMTAVSMARRRFFGSSFGLLPLAAAAGYVIMSLFSGEGPALGIGNLLVNLFILHAGVLLIFSGMKKKHLGEINLGAFIAALLVILRFVFSEYFMESLLARGIAFMVIGALFLAMNLMLSRRFGAAGRESRS